MSTIIRAYIDGQDVTSGSPTFASNAKTLRHIGRRSDSSATLFFQGQMGYAYLSQRALTAAEIRQLYVDPFCFLRKSRTVAFTSSPGLHLTEGFEGAGAPSGWTSTGSPDYDYTSTVLADAQSLKVVRSPSFDEARWNIGQDCDELWGRFMFRTPALPASAQGIFYVLDSGGSDLLEIKLLTTGKLSINGGLVSTTAAMLANTTYYVWWHYAKGAGANSEADVWFSESNSRPADGSFWHHSIANGAETAQGRNLSFTATGADGTLIFDNADVADSDLYTNAGNISGFSGFAFTAGGSLSGAAAISGASHLSFSAGGTASGIGALSGSANVTVSAGGSLSGTGALSGSTVLVFNAGATAIGIGALSGGSVITLNCAATAQGALQMVGSSTLTFSAGGSLTAGASLPTIRHPVYASLRAAHAYTYLIDSKTRSDLTPAHTYTELT